MTKAYKDIYYAAPDGLALYGRDYGGNFQSPPVLCMHGLTRNSADFHSLALRLKDKYRIISVDQRGRGLSDSDSNAENYRPDVYCSDMFALLTHLKLSQVTAIGTSMGGLMAMMMAAMKPGIFNGVIINDIGPDIDPAGLERIKSYVGNRGPFADWAVAEAAIKSQGPDVFPDYTDKDWKDFARRTCRQKPDGLIEFAYDPAISQPFKSDETAAAPPDLWPVFDALSNIPLLVIRGETSDILARQTAAKMIARHPNSHFAEIPLIGHAPMLDEPKSLTAIQALLETLL